MFGDLKKKKKKTTKAVAFATESPSADADPTYNAANVGAQSPIEGDTRTVHERIAKNEGGEQGEEPGGTFGDLKKKKKKKEVVAADVGIPYSLLDQPALPIGSIGFIDIGG